MRNAYSANRRINESFHDNKLQRGHKIRLIFKIEFEMIRKDGDKTGRGNLIIYFNCTTVLVRMDEQCPVFTVQDTHEKP